MYELFTFSHCLRELMKKNNLTTGQLCQCLDKTRTEIKRLLQTDGTEKQRKSAFEKIRKTGLLPPDSLSLLAESLEVSRLGVSRYGFSYAIDRVLKGITFDESPNEIIIDGNISFKERLSHLKCADTIEIFCINSCFSSVVDALLSLFDDPARKIHMSHLVHTEVPEATSAIFVAITLPLLLDPRYMPYKLHSMGNSLVHPIGGNVIAIRAKFHEEERQYFFTALSAEKMIELQNAKECDMFGYLSKMFSSLDAKPQPIKEKPNAVEDFTSLSMTFLSHELNRSSYSITAGLCFQQIPTDIAIAALRDGAFLQQDELADVIERTRSIHDQRFQNFYHKKKKSYQIMTVKGCRQFLETGFNSDHFVGFRPFTLEERKRIFQHMLEAAETNPYFVPLLFKNHEATLGLYIECNDKLGIALDTQSTNYDIKNGYHSVFLMYPDFTEQFMHFYRDTLVAEKSHSKQDSLAILKEMYRSFLSEFSLDT